MKLINERNSVRDVAARWERQYPKDGHYGENKETQAITTALYKLDVETATAADVAEIVGNNSWCEPLTCDECGEDVSTAVQLGQEPDYGSATATLKDSTVLRKKIAAELENKLRAQLAAAMKNAA